MPSSGVQTCALRSEEHTSELQSHDNLVCRLLLEIRRVLRSEEHTSELQSHDNIVCRLLLEKKFYVQAMTRHACYEFLKKEQRASQKGRELSYITDQVFFF